jgi:hypothetical protein
MRYTLRLYRLLVAGVLAVFTCILSGCDTGSDIMIENHSDEHIVVEFFLSRQEVDPCTAYFVGYVVIPGPAQMAQIDYKIADAGGTFLADGGVPILRGRKRKDILWNVIRYPAKGSIGCSEPVDNQFKVKVINKTNEKISVHLGDISLGEMKPREEAVIGPLEGSLWDVPELTVTDDQGKDRIFSWTDLRLQKSIPPYSIGEIPIVYLTIRY